MAIAGVVTTLPMLASSVNVALLIRLQPQCLKQMHCLTAFSVLNYLDYVAGGSLKLAASIRLADLWRDSFC